MTHYDVTVRVRNSIYNLYLANLSFFCEQNEHGAVLCNTRDEPKITKHNCKNGNINKTCDLNEKLKGTKRYQIGYFVPWSLQNLIVFPRHMIADKELRFVIYDAGIPFLSC